MISGRITDSIVHTFDLTRTGVPGVEVDSLNALARELLQRMQRPKD